MLIDIIYDQAKSNIKSNRRQHFILKDQDRVLEVYIDVWANY